MSDYDEVPYDFLCSLTNEIMMNPITMEDGQNYEEEKIMKYLKANNCISPVTKKKISMNGTKNNALKERIQKFLDNKPINVMVSKLEGGCLNFIMKPKDTILQLKENITDRTNIRTDQQILIFNGKQLSCNESMLKEYNINNDSIIHLTSRLIG
ncbi:hypothetical protein M9Y10_021327 [Tritrichomonas musculus]|uniref:Ubiquitin n=1 Tax=Tritrichomonas musculus TaxID=1915356 RepID=A0ABR2HDM3_9EUKA